MFSHTQDLITYAKKDCLQEVIYVTIGNPAFCLSLYLTGVHFRGELQHVRDVSEEKIKYRPVRTREIGSVRLSEELYDTYKKPMANSHGNFLR